MNFLLRENVLYLIHHLKKSIRDFIWLSMILVTWILLFNKYMKQSPTSTKVFECITRTLISVLTGSFLCLVKELLSKIFLSDFIFNHFFDRIQDSVIRLCVVQTLSCSPRREQSTNQQDRSNVFEDPTCHLSFVSLVRKRRVIEKKVFDMWVVYQVQRENVSACDMEDLVKAVKTSSLPTIFDVKSYFARRDTSDEIELRPDADNIFKNVARPGVDYIDEDDLLKFMLKEEVDIVFPLFDGAAETGKITRKAFTKWVVKVSASRRALAHTLKDIKSAVKRLNKFVTAILMVITVVIWLRLLDLVAIGVSLNIFAEGLVFLVYIFRHTIKGVFEFIMFVFIKHTFEVGDRCVVDGCEMVVEEMNLLTTVFLVPNDGKMYCPNILLATKSIKNYFASSDVEETVEFSIPFSTPGSKMTHLKKRIAEYLNNNPQHWADLHNLVVNYIENLDLKMVALYCNHTMPFHKYREMNIFEKYRERNIRRTELVFTVKSILEELQIDYSLLL